MTTTSGGNALAAIDFRAAVVRMIDDPDLTGDSLLFALAVLDMVYERRESRRRKPAGANWLKTLSERTDMNTYAIRRVFADDIPRYEVPRGDYTCTAPMIRREGACGKRASSSWVARDPETGEATWVGLCTRHRTHEADYQNRQQMKAWTENGKPEPPANTGGVLARYFTCDWDKYYRWANPWRWERSNGTVAPPPTTPRPRLAVIQGGKA